MKINLGGSLTSMLTVLFVALKLTHQIDWSWWWVTAPAWGGATLALAVLIIAVPFLLLSSARNRRELRDRVNRSKVLRSKVLL